MKNEYGLRFSIWWTSIGVLLVALCTYMSLIPLSPSKVLVFPESDKIMHLFAYTAMMFWLGQVYPKRPVALFIASGLIVLGILLEILQGLSGYRTFEYLDITANTLGIILGLFMAQTRLGRLFYAFEMFVVRSRG